MSNKIACISISTLHKLIQGKNRKVKRMGMFVDFRTPIINK